jgi:hypothetical protein
MFRWNSKTSLVGFFDPPCSEHAVNENTSATKPASLLAFHAADDGAPLKTIGTGAPLRAAS